MPPDRFLTQGAQQPVKFPVLFLRLLFGKRMTGHAPGKLAVLPAFIVDKRGQRFIFFTPGACLSHFLPALSYVFPEIAPIPVILAEPLRAGPCIVVVSCLGCSLDTTGAGGRLAGTIRRVTLPESPLAPELIHTLFRPPSRAVILVPGGRRGVATAAVTRAAVRRGGS